jgi:hypothetical protein
VLKYTSSSHPLSLPALLSSSSITSADRLSVHSSPACLLPVMTEYDYSPAAYERYQAKLNNVAKWVDRQSYEAPSYANPFVPTPSENERGSKGFYANRPLGRSMSPPVDDRYSQSHALRRGRDYHTHASNASSATLVQQPTTRYGSGSGSSTPHRSQSQPRSHKRPQTSRSQTITYDKPVSAGYGQPPVHSATYPAVQPQYAQPQHHHGQQYTSAPGQTVVMKQGKQTYVVVPPHGGRVEIRVRKFPSPSFMDLSYSLYLFYSHFPLPVRCFHLTS